jgi:hypothetical protein
MRYSFAYRNNHYDSAVTIGAGVGSKLAEMSPGQSRSLMILGIGGAVATWLFVTAGASTGRTLAACGVVMVTLAVGAIAEGEEA